MLTLNCSHTTQSAQHLESQSISSDPCTASQMNLSEHQRDWKNRVRVKALRSLDQFLSWTISDHFKTYALDYSFKKEVLHNLSDQMQLFARDYSYFSLNRPIVGKVSDDPKDLKLTDDLLKELQNQGALPLAVEEVLSKVLAYRDLKKGQEIYIPIESSGKLERFTVDHVFNLWKGMPAFGLIPDQQKIASILLFRGTDCSLESKRSFASLMSDLEWAGPGLSAFFKAQSEIHQWLKKVNSQGNAARVMGFSLGGALAAYTFIYENQWLAKRGSISFCAPGISESVIEHWELLPKETRNGFISYVIKGDLIPKFGKLFGIAYCLSCPNKFGPLTAHTLLMSSEATFIKARIDVVQENTNRQPRS